MKTKNKIVAVVEVAVVLCSMLVVAIPTIAADQTPQEASEVTTASEDDFVLGVYGNANEDDTIDMRDLTYVKLIFFGKKPETELADAKYDGKINPLDFIQIKLIIVGKEKELTFVQYIRYYWEKDIHEEPVTVNMPIKRIVSVSIYADKTLCTFGEQDKIVGVAASTKKSGELKTFFEDIPVVAQTSAKWDMEKIMEQKPDIVLAYTCYDHSDYKKQLDAAGIRLVQIDFYRFETYYREMRILGWMLDKKERAEELINFEQQHICLIKERVEDLTDEQKPRVYLEGYKNYYAYGPGYTAHKAMNRCGGTNIFDDLPETYAEIDPEAVIVRNPQVIIKAIYAGSIPCGYDVTDTGPMEELRNDIMNRPGWDHTDAVKNGRVYLLSSGTKSTHPSIYHSYMAKWFHPELFEDIDPVAIHREWMERFLGIEYKGVYAYLPYPV